MTWKFLTCGRGKEEACYWLFNGVSHNPQLLKCKWVQSRGTKEKKCGVSLIHTKSLGIHAGVSCVSHPVQ